MVVLIPIFLMFTKPFGFLDDWLRSCDGVEGLKVARSACATATSASYCST